MAVPRARALADALRSASAALIAVVETVPPERWRQVGKPGGWSPGKDAEHAAEATVMHVWHVARSVGTLGPEPPRLERARLTSVRSQAEVLALLRTTADDAAQLIEGLTEAQLALPAKPARRPPRTVADIITRPLIAHLGTHQLEIERKLRA